MIRRMHVVLGRATPMAAVAGLLLGAASALAQESEAAAAPLASGSPLESGLMILTVVGLVAVSGLLFRLFLNLKFIRSPAWLIPIPLVISGLLLLPLELLRPSGMENLLALARFLFTFLAFVAVLHPVTVLMLPTAAQQTRGGVAPLIRALLVAAVAFVGLLVLAKWSFPGLSLTPIFVTSGVLSIVLGLAVQDLLSNLLAGVVFSLERPFKVGDWVRIGQTEGEVLDIRWRTVTVRTRDNDSVLIPNNVIAKESVINFEGPTSLHLVKLTVGVSYETPCGLAVAALLEAASRVEGVCRTPATEVHFLEFQDSALLYELRVWIDNYASLHVVESDVRKEIWYSFKRNHITIPFPQRDVNLRQLPEVPLRNTARLMAVAGPLRGAIFHLGDQDANIGRGTDCLINIPDPQVSNRHAVVAPEGDGYCLKDLGSRHGTLVNGEAVKTLALQQGDEIRVGSVTFVYECSGAPAAGQRPRRARAARLQAPAAAPPAKVPAETEMTTPAADKPPADGG